MLLLSAQWQPVRVHDGATGLISPWEPPVMSDGAHENAAYLESHCERGIAATYAVALHLVAAFASCCKHAGMVGRSAGAARPLGGPESTGCDLQGLGFVLVLLVSVAWLCGSRQ